MFDIREAEVHGRLRLSLTGELDLASVPVLEDRLVRLRVRRRPVALDLSELEFIDSTGLRLLIRILGDARIAGWELQIEPTLTPPVSGLFRLVHLDRLMAGHGGRGGGVSPPTPSPGEPSD